MPTQSLTVAQATDENARYVNLIVSEQFDSSDFRDVAQIGCRTNPESLMSEGPPWSVLTTWVKNAPSAEFVSAALKRLDDLRAEGFHRNPWTRPEPEPTDRRSYSDDRGFSVTAGLDKRPNGDTVFEVRAKSPCSEP